MQDAIKLEDRGTPTAVIITTEFVHEAKVQGQALGMKDLLPAVIKHPLSTLTDTEIDQRAAEAIQKIEAILKTSFFGFEK